MLLSLLRIYPVRRSVEQIEQEMRQMSLLGEVACYGLTDGATRTAPT